VTWSLAHTEQTDPSTNEQAVARLTVTVKDDDATRIGRAFSSAAVEIALASYPGATMTAPPGEASPYGVYWPALVANDAIAQVVVLPDGDRVPVTSAGRPGVDAPQLGGNNRPRQQRDWGVVEPMPLGRIVGARSGDKGGNANLGVWARSDDAFEWLSGFLDVDRFTSLLPETSGLVVDRYELPNLRALNFVVHGLLGEGVASSTRQDPQAKGLGEWLRARVVDVPVSLLAAT
jgi:hypothetical protein